MPTLYIDRRTTELKVNGDVLICYEKGERIATIPLASVDRLYMKGDINLQISLLSKLGEKGIGVVFLQGRKNKPMQFLPQPHNDAYRRVTQTYLADNKLFCLTLAKNIVLNKCIKQCQFLAKFIEHNPKIITFIAELQKLFNLIVKQENIDSLRGIEGRMGAIYFAAFADILPRSLGFNGRNRRPPKDPVNAVLSLTYTLLYSEATLAVYGAGLDPYIGFFHTLHFGRKSLSCDLMEPIRPSVDEWIAECFTAEVLKIDQFSQTNEGCILGKEGRVIFYTAFEKVVSEWRKIFEKQAYELVHLICGYQTEYHQDQFDDYTINMAHILGNEKCDI
ncbi:CRISPR-associated endonuclease Cas1 [[Mannheimia] succiniciproducens]|uniref:CRISPR-associated endonuclease Cas1 n=1 Tax=Mannheimia succiniciproducens (strain KCTC 0769BP / MBEL55E) TaxID=221988 RepID=Q65S18_MANSM|nr:CRISPR-associated endonuclease Cas1 [[Mannheimia] succiniciproducens]AAU38242.1 unknown [[Mannheimia] succiniciproducens MBEL55E]